MSEKQLEPAKSVLAKVGIRNAERVTGKSLTRVYRWMASSERGGTDGVIPSKEARKLLKFAEEQGIDLKPSDFFALAPTAPTEGAAA